eukprot:CAMPEP_0197473770 /NCGR_PEP_ID=MMETSP1309-20131121/5180_1 /TAXON_ID=464262 /ORGANISM="Genus nov. species nov., Strain RCC998" /LENGTH=33 /DNA_ID= /DNA_START= /DNA_END= /DNA_ORIENTATION=
MTILKAPEAKLKRASVAKKTKVCDGVFLSPIDQ